MGSIFNASALVTVGDQPNEAAATPVTQNPRGFFDLVLRNDKRLNTVLLDEASLTVNIQKLLGLALLGLSIHGVVVGLTAHLLTGSGHSLDWEWMVNGHPMMWMPLTFSGAFLLALAVCLPSFYFYTQLSGLDASFRIVTTQALRVLASTSVLLLGFLPFFAAVALGSVVGLIDPEKVLAVGVAAPFLVGLFGIRTLYRSFQELITVLPITHERRGNFVLLLVLCWGVVYSTVAPVALYRIGEALAKAL
jgi:hypothetical protein